MDHTPEPWNIFSNAVEGEPWHVMGILHIATCTEQSPHDRRFDGVSKANARRIVACVNACVGLKTEDLENDPKYTFSTYF